MRRKLHPKLMTQPTAPDSPPAQCDSSRRRFLRQLTAGTGALCLTGVPVSTRSQELTVKFYRLDSHPATIAVDPAEAIEEPSEPSEIAEVVVEPPDPVDPVEPDPVSTAVGIVEENRALWVEPGYLVLVRWTRPERDNAPVAALEGAGPLVEEFLSSSVTSVDQLHNLDRLHRIEVELTDFLQRRVGPATIDVLHLDHDCTIVCGVLDPSMHFPEDIAVDGGMPGPGWE